jgi:hypothetical protein
VSLPRRTDRGSTVEAGPTRRGPAAGASGGARTRIRLPDDPYSADVPRRSRLRGPLIVVGVVVVLFAVIALVNQNHHDSTPKSAAATSAASAAPTPGASSTSVTTTYGAGLALGSADGVPVGYPHTSDGAEAAAANYVAAFNSTEMVYSWYRVQLLNAIAAPSDAAALRVQLDDLYAKVDSGYSISSSGQPPAGDTFVSRATPVGVSLVSDSGSTAVVSIWAVRLLGLAGTNPQNADAAVSEDWSTFAMTLSWTRGDWKWVGFTLSDGPAPLGGLQTPAPGQTLQAAVSKYGGLTYGR